MESVIATNKSKSTQTNSPGWSSPPATQATTNLQSMVDTPVDYATPLRNTYARAEQNLTRSYNNPLGSYTTADVRDKSLRSQRSDLSQSLGMDLSNAAQQSSQNKFDRQSTVAGLTAPQMYNAKSVSAQPFTGGDVAQMAVSAVTGALT